MKKSVLFAAVAVVASLLVSCQGGSGTPLTSSSKLWPAADKNGKWGYINEAATELVIDAQWGNANPFSCKRAIVKKVNSAEYLIIKENGDDVPTETLKAGTNQAFFYNCLTYYDGKKYGMIDVDGKEVFPADYAGLGSMSSSDLVWFMEKNSEGKESYGYMKRGQKNKEAIPAKFQTENGYGQAAWDFVDDAAVVIEGKERGIIGTDGKYLAKWKLTDNYSDLMSLGQKRIRYKEKDATVAASYGMKDLDGNKKGSASFQQIYPFTDCDLALAQNEEGKYVFLNTDGKKAFSGEFYDAYPFSDGLAWVKKESTSEWQAINQDGTNKFKLKSDDNITANSKSLTIPAGVFHNGLCLVIKSGTYKYIDKEGNPKDYSWTNGQGGQGGEGGFNPGEGGEGGEGGWNPGEEGGEGGWNPGEEGGEGGWGAPARVRQHQDHIVKMMSSTPYGAIFANMAR